MRGSRRTRGWVEIEARWRGLVLVGESEGLGREDEVAFLHAEVDKADEGWVDALEELHGAGLAEPVVRMVEACVRFTRTLPARVEDLLWSRCETEIMEALNEEASDPATYDPPEDW